MTARCVVLRASSSADEAASAPAISTPVGPPPMTAKVSHSLARPSVGSRSACSNAPKMRLRSHGVGERLQPARARPPTRRAEVGRLRPPHSDDQAVVADAARRGRARPAALATSTSTTSSISTFTLSVAALEQPRGSARRTRSEARADRHLVEQRLEEVVVLAVDERHVARRAPGQPPRAAEPAEAAADDHDPAPLRGAVSRHGGLRRRAGAQPLEQVVADPQPVGHRRQRRVHRADAGEEARVDDVEVVELVRPAVRVRAPSVSGSLPKRQVPAWWATPATGISFLR